MKEPKLPNKYNKNKRILTDEQLSQAQEMLNNWHSQRFVANHFNVSRNAIMVHLRPELKEYFRKKSKEFWKNNPDKCREYKKKSEIERYRLKNTIFPLEMKICRKKSAELMGKKYFAEKQREFRLKHPDYYKKFSSVK